LPQDISWLDEIQQPPRKVPRGAPLLPPLLSDEAGHPIQTLADWQRRRQELRRRWLDFLGPLDFDQPETPRSRAPRFEVPRFEVLAEDRPSGVIRRLIRYEVEPGWPVEAYLLEPVTIQNPLPGVIVFHSTVPYTIRQPAGLEGEPEKAFGLKLARRGFVTLCPRCFLWSDELCGPFRRHVRQRVKQLRLRHPQACGMAKMVHDAQVSLDLLAHMPEVDPQRLGAMGHSLGAKQTLYLSALDERIRVAVSSEGGIGRKFSNWSASWYHGRRYFRSQTDYEHHQLMGLIAPRAFLLVGGGSADGDRSWPFVDAALPVYRLHGGRPRVGLFNHQRGHTVPAVAERRIDDWFKTYL
jgi:dienelactone hydrolase